MNNYNYDQDAGAKKKKKSEDEDVKYNPEKIMEMIDNDQWEKIVEIYKNPQKVLINGNNLLHLACRYGAEPAINYYLNKYPELYNIANSVGDTCSHILAKYNHNEILKRTLTKFPSNLTLVGANSQTILTQLLGDPYIVGYILQNLDPEYLRNLDAAKIKNIIEIAEVIRLNKGKDIYLDLLDKLSKSKYKLSTNDMMPGVIFASKENKHEALDVLLSNGGDPNSKDKYQKTALVHAINNKSYKAAEILLENGANINYTGPENDMLPINLAIMNKDKKMVDLLMKHKPNLNIKNNNLDSTLNIALSINKESGSNIVSSDHIFKMIKNSDIHEQNLKGVTPLHIMAKFGDWKFYTSILKDKLKSNIADFNIKDSYDNTPLDYISDDDNKHKFSKLFSKKKTNPKNEKVNMPTIGKTNHGKFNSDVIHNVIYTIIMLKKYKELGIVKNHDYKKKREEFNSLVDYKSPYGKVINEILSIYYNYFGMITPHLLLWRSSNLYFVDPDLETYTKPLLEDNKIRFIMYKLTLISNFNSTHANILIYDKQNNRLERFEPYGKNELLEEDKLDLMLKNRFRKIINPKLKYYTPADFLSEAKFQVISSDSDVENRKLGDPAGFCLAWCFWYLETRLNNPDASPRDLANNSIKEIIKNTKSKHNPVLDYIRNYSDKLDKLKNDIMKEANVDEEDFYNIVYENDHLIKILKYISNYFE